MYDNVWPYADLRMAIRGVHMAIRTAYIWPYAFLRMAIRKNLVWPYANMEQIWP